MQILLVAHIAGALMTAVVIGFCFLVKPQRKLLIGMSIFQIISGVWLFALRPASATHFCASLGLYLFFVTGTLVYCHFRLDKSSAV